MSICIMLNPQDHLGSLLRTPTPRSPTWVALTSWPWYKANQGGDLSYCQLDWTMGFEKMPGISGSAVFEKRNNTCFQESSSSSSYLSIFRSMHSTSSILFLSFISIRSPCFCYPLPRCRCSPKAVSVVNLAAANHGHHNFTHPSTVFQGRPTVRSQRMVLAKDAWVQQIHATVNPQRNLWCNYRYSDSS